MKKICICITVIALLMSLAGCQKQISDPYDLEVTKEPFEELEVSHSMMTHITYPSEYELYGAAELVFIGMPTDTFTECEAVYYNLQGERISPESGEKSFDFYTLRNVKIIEMIKGDYEESEITVADLAVVKKTDDGQSRIVGLPYQSTIQKKNVKYIYYVYKSNDETTEYYFTEHDSGLVNVDGLHSEANSNISDKKLTAMKTRFADKFTKYDRTSTVENVK